MNDGSSVVLKRLGTWKWWTFKHSDIILESGSTAGRVSSFRPKAFIIGLIQGENIETLLLRWGVIPIHASKFKNVQDMFKLGSKVSLETGLAKKNDLVVVIAGMPIGIPGNTNLMRVIQLPEH